MTGRDITGWAPFGQSSSWLRESRRGGAGDADDMVIAIGQGEDRRDNSCDHR
jgi:hypothetical protein